jgi:hypothetical protein
MMLKKVLPSPQGAQFVREYRRISSHDLPRVDKDDRRWYYLGLGDRVSATVEMPVALVIAFVSHSTIGVCAGVPAP